MPWTQFLEGRLSEISPSGIPMSSRLNTNQKVSSRSKHGTANPAESKWFHKCDFTRPMKQMNSLRIQPSPVGRLRSQTPARESFKSKPPDGRRLYPLTNGQPFVENLWAFEHISSRFVTFSSAWRGKLEADWRCDYGCYWLYLMFLYFMLNINMASATTIPAMQRLSTRKTKPLWMCLAKRRVFLLQSGTLPPVKEPSVSIS